MMQNNNLSVLPFYDKIERQHHRQSYAHGNTRPLIFPQGRILPFQFQHGQGDVSVSSVKAFDIDGNLIEDITERMIDAGLTEREGNIIFPSLRNVGVFRVERVPASVEINGIHWATRNIDLSTETGFAKNPEDLGMFFQWGRNVGWSNTNPLRRWNNVTKEWEEAAWNNTLPPFTISWQNQQEILPEGWRIPEWAELQTLSSNHNRRMTTINGVVVWLFEEKLFLPRVQYRLCLSANFAPGGMYWSNTARSHDDRAFALQLWDTVSQFPLSRASGASIRCVADTAQYIEKREVYFGCAYLEIELSNGKTFYSDIFKFHNEHEMSKMLKIEWLDNENLEFDAGHIDYTPPFKNEVYLKTQLGKPKYPFEEEGEERGGYFFPEKQISKKTFRFSAHGIPEYLVDAMRIIRMSDNVIITSFGIEYTSDTFLLEPVWTDVGDVATCNCEFDTDTVVKKIGGWIDIE